MKGAAAILQITSVPKSPVKSLIIMSRLGTKGSMRGTLLASFEARFLSWPGADVDIALRILCSTSRIFQPLRTTIISISIGYSRGVDA